MYKQKAMELRDQDLEIEFLRRSGPGGQHRNKRATGVRLVHKPTGLMVMATERRSQPMNLALAKERLLERLIRRATPRKARKPTRPTKGSDERRIKAKKIRSERKKDRKVLED